MKTSGIIYHSEWESDGESVSVREEVTVTRLETSDNKFTSGSISSIVDPALQGREVSESYFSESRESTESGVVGIQGTRQEVVSEPKRDGWPERSGLSSKTSYGPDAKVTLPKRKRFGFPRKLVGLFFFLPKKLLRALRMFKLRGIVHYPIRITTGTFKSILKILKQPLKLFRVFKVVNKNRTSKALKTSSKYSKKSGKALFKGTKWLTIKSIKLIPPTVSLSYKGAKKIKSNDILLRLVVAAIAGIIFFSAVFVGYGQF